MIKKYPIGMKVKYSPVNVFAINDWAKADVGKTGTIVGYSNSGKLARVELQDSEMMKHNWGCGFVSIEIDSIKPISQLLFDFMY